MPSPSATSTSPAWMLTTARKPRSLFWISLPRSVSSVTSLARLGLLAYPLAWPMAEWLGQGSPARRRWTLVAALVLITLMVAQLANQSP